MKKKGSTSATKKRVGPARRRKTARPGIQVLYSDAQIRKRVRELAKQIDRDYRGRFCTRSGSWKSALCSWPI